MLCGCGEELEWKEVQELKESTCFGRCECSHCKSRFGIEGEGTEVGLLLNKIFWTDEAQYTLDRLPPYVRPYVQEDVEQYAQAKSVQLVTSSVISESKNHGTVAWSQEAEQRLERVPGPVRAMARIELERTAIDRGMSEVTVDLMEEVKARYFGMGAPQAN